jgi:cytochrome c-type biogenesis protein CcmH
LRLKHGPEARNRARAPAVNVVVGLLLALVLAAPAVASERHPTLGELEGEVMCPTCKTTLDQSTAPIADRIRQFISARIAAGDTKSEIKRKLVLQFGPAVLAEPSKHGFNLLAWVLPFVALGVGAAALAWLAWRWSRRRDAEASAVAGEGAIDPELERRLDDELARFDG